MLKLLLGDPNARKLKLPADRFISTLKRKLSLFQTMSCAAKPRFSRTA